MTRKTFLARSALVLLGFAIVNLFALHLVARPVPDHPFFNGLDQYPLVIAHAGSKLYPTDTMYALERYAAMGVDILEMDTNMTEDGVIILIHDPTVDRTTDGTGDVREMNYADLRSLDAAYQWTLDDGKTYPLRGQGVFIPTLKEVFEAFPGYKMIIEIKQETPSMAEPFCQLIRDYGMAENVIVPSFSEAAIQEFRQVCPEVATAASPDEVREFVIKNFLMLAGTLSPEYVALQVPESRDGIPIVNKWLLWAADHRNVQVHIWTLNDPDDMVRFTEMGVDGIMTDRTDLLITQLERNK